MEAATIEGASEAAVIADDGSDSLLDDHNSLHDPVVTEEFPAPPPRRFLSLTYPTSSSRPDVMSLLQPLLLILLPLLAATCVVQLLAGVSPRSCTSPTDAVGGHTPTSPAASSPSPHLVPRHTSLVPVLPGRTLVMVVHYAADAAYVDNLDYFVRKAVRCWQDADYRIVVQRGTDEFDEAGRMRDTGWAQNLPPLPVNGRYIAHPNKCFDWGTAGWLLQLPPSHAEYVNVSRYRYFFLLNTSVRGPYLPVLFEQRMDRDARVQCPTNDTSTLFSWFDVFHTRMTDEVRYVGCTINCGHGTHVQSFAIAMDFVALQVLWQAWGMRGEGLSDEGRPIRVVDDFDRWQRGDAALQSAAMTGMSFRCSDQYWDTVVHHEIGSSQAMLKAGYNIAVLMRYWEDTDFRALPEPCSRTPYTEGTVSEAFSTGIPRVRESKPADGNERRVTVQPDEVVFLKYKTGSTLAHIPLIQTLDEWEAMRRRTVARQMEHYDMRPVTFPRINDSAAAANHTH